MQKHFWFRIGFVTILITQLIISLITPSTLVFADQEMNTWSPDLPIQEPVEAIEDQDLISNFTPIRASIAQTTTLDIQIISTPWATLDSNNPTGVDNPNAYIVEAKVQNTGAVSATNVLVNLDYNPTGNWVLLSGEDPNRAINSLAPNEVYYAYWFASYSTVIGSSHQYTVTASASNASAVATSDNFYGNPEIGKTVKTRSTLSTGNSGVTNVSANVVVGVAFTVTVDTNLGTNPQKAAFSPVGNFDFDPSANRLISTEVRFYNTGGQEQIFIDQLYFDTVPNFAEQAEVTYTFIALTPANTRICPYTSIEYNSNVKFDQFYCNDVRGTTIPITGTVGLSLTKTASSPTIQQGQTLTYTIDYTNTGDSPLTFSWIWDQIDPSVDSIIPSSINPPDDPNERTVSRVAWDLGTIPAVGQQGYTGTLSLSVFVDGGGQDLLDNQLFDNSAFFGINQGSLPTKSALTSTVTTQVLAPQISTNKTDGLSSVEPGGQFTYTLNITNTGSIPAQGLVITDVLPSFLTLNGTPSPAPDTVNNQILVWNSLGPIPGNGGSVVITIPAILDIMAPNATVLSNLATIKYENQAGHVFTPKTAMDTTVVNAPVLSIDKRDFPDPVITGNTISYTLFYTNSGLGTATNVVITDAIPISTTYQTCSGGTTCGPSLGVVSWDVGTVAPNTSGFVSFSALVSDTLQTGELILNNNYGITSSQTGYIAGNPETTLVNRNAAFFDGYTFIDRNGNGVKDSSEGILSGITVTLPIATVPVTTTDATGYYHFRVEQEAPILVVSAAVPSGFFRTTPITVTTKSTFGITQTINFGYAPITSTFGTVFGTVFGDNNANGVQDLGESGLASVNISSPAAANSPVTTNQYGQYTLRFDTPGQVTITETVPQFYVATTPNIVSKNIVTGTNNGSPLDFGNFLGIQISGKVFEDANVNGVNEQSESGVPGALVTAKSANFTTSSSGIYSLFIGITDSSPITITEADPLNFLSTNAIPGAFMSKVDANTLRINNPISGTVYLNGDFGDIQASNVVTVSGRVWDDNGTGGGIAANGILDGSEPGLPGAVISLSSGLTQTTGLNGLYTLFGPPNQTITVTEVNPTGYVSTNAIPGTGATKLDNDNLLISSLGGGMTSPNNLFGDVMTSNAAVITGTVFDDQNEDGIQGPGEPGLPGVSITLEVNGGNTIPVLTGLNGLYQFATAPGSNVRITSGGPGGSFYPTTPETLFINPPNAGIFPNNNFGYSNDPIETVITGIVFDDQNSDGSQDFGELGLSGAVITLTLPVGVGNPIVTTTGGSGIFTLKVNTTGPHTVQEENPSGYRSTTPDTLNVNVSTLGTSYFVEFGDTNSPNFGSVFGTVFDDINGNGTQESTEPGLPGVVISMTVSGGVLTSTTKSFGQFSYGFDVSEAGFHTVSEQDPALPGYRSTTPDVVNVFVSLGTSQAVNFGDTLVASQYSSILGTVFDDSNQDGNQDPGELGIKDVLISLSNGMTTTTNTFGGYTFALTSDGGVRVTEDDPNGYYSTTPNEVMVLVTLPLGQVYSVNFGDSNNPFAAGLYGTVFEDLNINGVWDGSEPGINGVEVTLEGESGLPLQLFTNEWGQYTFNIDLTGTYTITEKDLPNYLSTNAIPGDPSISKLDDSSLLANITSLGRDFGGNNFGDALASQVITITGEVWNDNGAGGGTAGDGVKDPGEPGLSGATINLSSGLSKITGTDGKFSLFGPPGQTLTVSEVNPGGYQSTNAIEGSSATKIDNDTIQVSPLSGGGISSGHLFGDIQVCSLDSYEGDDTFLQANVLGAGVAVSQTHNFCADAADWLSFDAKAGNVYTITTSSWGNRADTILSLYDRDGTTLLEENDDYPGTTDFSSQIVWIATFDGTYFIKVSNQGDETGVLTDYNIWLEKTNLIIFYLPIILNGSGSPGADIQPNQSESIAAPLGVIDHACPDTYETDDSWFLANPIAPGVLQDHSLDSNPTSFAVDKDFVRFDLLVGTTITFTLDPVNNTPVRVEVYDINGSTLSSQDVSGSTQFNWMATYTGRHYLGVISLSNSFEDSPCGVIDVGFQLSADFSPLQTQYLPIITKE